MHASLYYEYGMMLCINIYLLPLVRSFHFCCSRGQIDLVDYQHCPDGEFRYLLTYVDHGTKYAMVQALKSKVILFYVFNHKPQSYPKHSISISIRLNLRLRRSISMRLSPTTLQI
jgi:hypothetical protein